MAAQHEVCGCAVRVYAGYACQYDTGCDLSRAKTPIVLHRGGVTGHTDPVAVAEHFIDIFPEDSSRVHAGRKGVYDFGGMLVRRGRACAHVDKQALNDLLSIGAQVDVASLTDPPPLFQVAAPRPLAPRSPLLSILRI